MISIPVDASHRWAVEYIGTPWVAGGRHLERDGGLDCWGLVVDIYRRAFGIDLPEFNDLAGFILGSKHQGAIEKLKSGWHEATHETLFGLGTGLLLGMNSTPRHCGIIIDQDLNVLHTKRHSGVVCQPLKRIRHEYSNISFWNYDDGSY